MIILNLVKLQRVRDEIMSQSQSLVRSTFLLTASIFITKVLGILYVIPFYMIIGGEENLAPYNYAYQPYTIMLTVAGAGMPLAVAKYVSKYNAIGAYKVSQKLYKSSLLIMSLTGIIGFIILYLIAPWIASETLAEKGGAWSVQDITEIIRVIAVAVIFIPFLSTWRGIFQGYDSMGPTAVSTVIEQVARITFLLGGTYLALHVFDKNILFANEIATFAAAIGALFAVLTLAYYWHKRKPFIDAMINSDNTDTDINYKSMYKEILLYSIPFITVSLCVPLFLMVDQFTHNKGLTLAGVPVEFHNELFTMLNLTTNKLVMIPTSLAAGFAISLIPSITKTHAKKQYKEMHSQIKTSLGLLMFITVPASIGIMVLSAPLYSTFYSYNIEAINILFFYAPVGILLSLFSVTAAMIQGIDKQRLTVFVILGALAIKIIINLPLIVMFHTIGAVFGTAIALLFGITANLLIIKKHANYKLRRSLYEFAEIFLYSIIMMIAVEVVYFILIHFLNVTVKLEALLILFICAIVGVVVYAMITMKTGLAERYFGSKVTALRRKLRW